MKRVDGVMQKALDEKAFPGAVIRVSEKGRLIYEKAFGKQDYGNGPEVTVSTVYDLASLTKPLATAPAFMLLMQQGMLDFDSSLSRLLPGYPWGDKGDVSLVQLLTHTSGLPAHRPYFEELKGLQPEKRPSRMKELLVREPLIAKPGERVCYSDIGFMILAWVVESVTGRPLSRFVEKEIYGPLGIHDLFYMRLDDANHRDRLIAPTEQCPWRKKLLCGEVHDDNAWIMAGEGSHAGLFGTAEGVDQLLTILLNYVNAKNRVLETDVVNRFLSPWGNTGRTPGCDMPSDEGASSGRYFSRSSVGHLGFTGTSFWADREKKLTVVLLSNRVHPSRGNTKIRIFRPLIHDALMEDLGML